MFGSVRLIISSHSAPSVSPLAEPMAFQGRRFHDSMPFADSSSQDMDFWRQRCALETRRCATPSQYATGKLESLPSNPFKDSAGMLYGRGVSPRTDVTPMGSINPYLSAYRAVVPSSPTYAHANKSPFAPQGMPHAYWQIPRTAPGVPMGGLNSTPEERAARGAARLKSYEPPPTRAPVAYERSLFYEQPHQRIAAPIRLGKPRASLDARMYASSPG